MRRSRSPSFLAGLLFDDRGNRMTPSHANKKGVRYRYYVSQALLQNRKLEKGGVTRISAPGLEQLVVAAIRAQIGDSNAGAEEACTDRKLLGAHVRQVVLTSKHIDRVSREWRGGHAHPDSLDANIRKGAKGYHLETIGPITSSARNVHEGGKFLTD
jgi:hypothetical protein